MVDGLEGFGEVDGGEECSSWRFLVVEAGGDFVAEREKSRSSRATRSEAVLMRRSWEVT